jgi:hypothetical protein
MGACDRLPCREWHLIGISDTSSLEASGSGNSRFAATSWKVSDGTRTRDRLDHNQELYQLSYAHQAETSLAVRAGPDAAREP